MTTLVVFDIDGTLLDSAHVHQDAFLAALYEIGLTDIDTQWDHYEHRTDSWIFTQLYRAQHGHGPSDEDRLFFSALLQAQLRARTLVTPLAEVPGAVELLRALEAHPAYTVAYATGGVRPASVGKLVRLGAISAIDRLATATEHAWREHIVLEAVERAKRSTEQEAFDRIVCVGDGAWDARGAQRLGFEFLGIAADPAHFEGRCPDGNVMASLMGADLSRPLFPAPLPPDEVWSQPSPVFSPQGPCPCLD